MAEEDEKTLLIVGLQETLRQRNKTIEELREQITQADQSDRFKKKLDAAYRRGWEDAGNHLMNITHEAAIGLRKLRVDAFNFVLHGDWEGEKF